MTVDDWRVKYEILNAENDKLRVLLATSNANCAFCGLPAAEMGTRSGASKRLKRAASSDGALLPLFLAPGQLNPFIDKGLFDGPLAPVDYTEGDRVQRGRRRLYLDWHPSLEAARCAAIAWVDQQEGRNA